MNVSKESNSSKYFKRLQFPDAYTLRNEMNTGELSATQLIKDSLTRIKNSHKKINAAVHVFEKQATQEAKTPKKGPLAGIPISLKEIIANVGTVITAGSYIYQEHTPTEDAPLVKNLKEAGAIIIAKGNIPEFSMSHETYNLRFGRTNNPYDTSKTAGGSTGGDAALVATGGSVIGIGTDLGGSSRYPAHCCGLVGFKPVAETISKEGVYPTIEESFLQSMFSVGPITRSVRDAQLATEIMAGKAFPRKSNTAKGRLIIPQQFEMVIKDQNIQDALVASENYLATEGFQIVHQQMKDIPAIYQSFVKILMGHTFGRPNRAPSKTPNGEKFTLLNETVRQLKGKPMVWPTLYFAFLGIPFIKPSAKQLIQEETKVIALRKKYNDILGDDGIVLLPTSGTVALKHGAASKHDFFTLIPKLFTPMIFGNVLNLASITVPAWNFRDTATGLPASVMLTTKAGNEDLLFETAKLLEVTWAQTKYS